MENDMNNIKKYVKNVVKSVINHRKILIIALVFLMIFVLLSSFIYFITLDDGIYKDGDMSNTPYAASTYTKNVKFTENGIKFIYLNEETGEEEEKTSSEMAKIVWDQMSKAGNNVENYLDTVEEFQKLMNAEIITQYPKLDKDVELNGTIEFERNKTDGSKKKLEFINLETFNSYIKNQQTEVLDYYTLDENENLLIGVVNETTEKLSSNDPAAVASDYSTTVGMNQTKTDINVYSQCINYKDAVSKYTMPFQYMWAFIVVGDDKDVGLELADLVENSSIIISIYDNITTTTNTSTYTYNKEKKINVSATATVTTNYGTYTKNDSWSPAAEVEEDEDYEVVHQFIYKDDVPIIDITKADVWIVNYSKEYTFQSSQQESEESNERSLDDTEYKEIDGNPRTSTDGSDLEYYSEFSDKLGDLVEDLVEYVNDNVSLTTVNNVVVPLSITSSGITSCSADYFIHNVNRNQLDNNKVEVQKYIAGTVTNEPKIQKKTDEEIRNGTGEDNFVTILCDPNHSDARRKLTDEVPSWLFEILEENPDTVNMVDLTRYLFYVVTGSDRYGVTEYDFGVYQNSAFSTAGAIYGDSIQEKVWFMIKGLGYSDIAAAGAMGNIHYESGSFNPAAIEHGYTDTTGGIGICQWTNNNRGSTGRNANLKAFATSKGSTWKDENIQVEFLNGELGGGEASGYATNQLMNKKSYYGSDLACDTGWINATSVEDATKAFCYSFERPGKQAAQSSMATRISYAQQYYSMYAGMEAPQEINTTLTGDDKSKMQSMISEAIRIANDDRYQYSQAYRESTYYYDCSSFVSRLYTQYFGISRLDSGTAGRGTDNIRANAKSKYKTVALTSLQPGDILWKDRHVALYIGSNQIAEAASPNSGILVKGLTNGRFSEAYRIIY